MSYVYLVAATYSQIKCQIQYKYNRIIEYKIVRFIVRLLNFLSENDYM